MQPGKQALERVDRQRVETDGTSSLECSLHLDKHMEREEPNSRRWDYLLVVRGASQRAVAVEVHPATASEVRAVLEKREWAVRLLGRRCSGLQIAGDDWHWVASGKVFLRSTDPQSRLLRQSGLGWPRERLVLSSK